MFPLSGALLLPFSHRPLNIFEPRYVEMVDHALAGNRLIGLIQPEDTVRGKPARPRAAAEDRHRRPPHPLGRERRGPLLHHPRRPRRASKLVSELTVMTPVPPGRHRCRRTSALDFARAFGEDEVDRHALPQDDEGLCRVRQFRTQLGRDQQDRHRRPRQFRLHGLALWRQGKAVAARSPLAAKTAPKR